MLHTSLFQLSKRRKQKGFWMKKEGREATEVLNKSSLSVSFFVLLLGDLLHEGIRLQSLVANSLMLQHRLSLSLFSASLQLFIHRIHLNIVKDKKKKKSTQK
jgi:hypothetical protein